MKMMSETHVSTSTPPIFLILSSFTHISTFSFQKLRSDFFSPKKHRLCIDDEERGKQETRTKEVVFYTFLFFSKNPIGYVAVYCTPEILL